MTISKEAFDEWKEHPVTKEIFKEVNQTIMSLSESIMSGETLSFSAEDSHGKTNRIVGQIEGLRQLINISFEE